MKKYDGCSGGMSKAWRFIFRKNPPWEGACDKHDQAYAKGGTWSQRKQADVVLMCDVAMLGYPIIGFLMYLGVRAFGSPYWPFSWRWHFTERDSGYESTE